MSLQPGLYKVVFKTQLGEGIGIVVLEGGSLRGGDAVYAWVGRYEEPEGGFDAQVTISRHTRGEAAASVFGVNDAVVRLRGRPDGEAFDVEGSTDAAPDLRFEARLTHLADPRQRPWRSCPRRSVARFLVHKTPLAKPPAGSATAEASVPRLLFDERHQRARGPVRRQRHASCMVAPAS